MNKQTRLLKKRGNHLLRQIVEMGPFIEGSLAITSRMCTTQGCICHRGKKHQAMYLTWKENRKTRSMYIPVERQKQALAMNRNYKKLKAMIRKLSDIHKKLLIAKNPE